MEMADYIVVGSGASGSIAAQTLVEDGANVVMIDVGVKDDKYSKLIPQKDFLSIRRNEDAQRDYFLGKDFEGVAWGKMGKGAQITPPRRHIMAMADKYLAIDSETFEPLESLAYGGLGAGWGLQCWAYSDDDIAAVGLDAARMREAYETVAQRIGISATYDDAGPYTLGPLKGFQPSPKADRNQQLILDKYAKHKKSVNKKGVYIGRTPLALLTQDAPGRKKYAYRDMDFYSDNDKSAWRPWITVEALRRRKNFKYLNGLLLLSFEEKKDHTRLFCLDVETDQAVELKCRKLILATGAYSTARIVLRSFGKLDHKLPLLCNPYTYAPSIQPKMLGRGAEKRKLGFGQVSLFLDPRRTNFDISVASTYSYQSLMLFRVIREAPLNLADARIIMNYLMSGLVIMVIHHPDHASSKKYLKLVADKSSVTGDKLRAEYELSDAELEQMDEREKQFAAAMRKLGTYAFKRIKQNHGSSIHYAGTLPFSEKSADFHLAPNGRLHGTRSVFVADSSGFKYLPARGLTFSLMANAHITAKKALKNGE
ncbi:MAG TPA: GMC oxidoreductase [Candidatus Saccharimonadales bacterium]|nr:GMC oxidoreductase [Candidatus Saccharimonadales bacterium]